VALAMCGTRDGVGDILRGMPRRSREITDGTAQGDWHPPGMSLHCERLASAAPRIDFRCPTCGYGVVRRNSPARCPMCGGTEWDERGWKPFSALPPHFLARISYSADDAANEPLRREAAEVADSAVRGAASS
jgi:rubredoxin